MIREADAYTIRHEPVSDIDLMERASSACAAWILANISHHLRFHVFAGTGNNGGDGLAVARMLFDKNIDVTVYLVGKKEDCSPSCRINLDRITTTERTRFFPIMSEKDLPEIGARDVVIDSLFGSGLTRPLTGIFAAVIKHVNNSNARIISIDVPSGLYCDKTVFGEKEPIVVRASQTLTFSPPKLAFFFPENEEFTGNWKALDIGISSEFIKQASVKNFMSDEELISGLLLERNRFDHKGKFGHALLICGGKGKMGAAILAARAALRSGVGLLTVHGPSSGLPILQSSVPEAMYSSGNGDSFIEDLPDLPAFSSIGIGCGIGKTVKTAGVIKLLIQESRVPLVFDADALNILSENKTWLGFLPPNSILTPHPGEFQRLTGRQNNNYERLQAQRDFSFRFQCFVILKGAYTSITTPDGNCYFNTTGNPGMATGGSGDALTGIITALLSRGYSPLPACLLGVYTHGLAGDLARAIQGQESLIAGDIIENLGKAFISIYGKF